MNELSEVLKALGAQLGNRLEQAVRPVQRPYAPLMHRCLRDVRRPPVPRSEIRCYECGLFGHIARERPRRPGRLESGNAIVCAWRQGQP